MASVVNAQTDFSAGELDPTVKRDNKSAIVQAGVRQAQNFRILNSKGMKNRPGRRALFVGANRVEEFQIAPGVTYYIEFSAGAVIIYNSSGGIVLSGAQGWSAAQAKQIVWALYDKSIYITNPLGSTPLILTWDGVSTWTPSAFAEKVIGGQKRTLFYRLAPKGITLAPSGLAGAINIVFSDNVLVAGMIGTRIRYQGRQMTITGVTDGAHGTATVNEALASNSVNLAFTSTGGTFVVGQVVTEYLAIGGPTGVSGVITAVGGGAGGSPLTVTLASTGSFTNGNAISVGGSPPAGVNIAVTVNEPAASVVWDQEVMNSYQGWPRSCFVDQDRLVFCDFPAVPQGIAWSAALAFDDFYPDAFAADGLSTDAIFELVPGKRRVLYGVPGMDASEFIFCDKGLFYIQITAANPLKPGSVSFSTISEDECGQVQPRRAGEFIIYATGGLNQLMVLRIFGAYTRAYKTENITELNAHLFTSITAIAIMTASASFAERYVFIQNADTTVISGKYTLSKNNELEGIIGWTPWSGSGAGSWVSCSGANVLFTGLYAPPGSGNVSLVEILDDSRYLDASQLYNTQPVGLPIPGGKGPLWYIANGTVDLMDGPAGTRMMGTYQIDANGFLIPQGRGGEDFTSVNLIAGQTWTAYLEPFVPPVQEGQDVGQRMWKRRIKRAQIYVSSSTGFVMQRLWSERTGPHLPAVGTVMKERRIPMWFQGEDSTQPPTVKEASYLDRPTGYFHDPRWRIAKDTPGPLVVEEISFEVST